jgi:hypothetical protein
MEKPAPSDGSSAQPSPAVLSTSALAAAVRVAPGSTALRDQIGKSFMSGSSLTAA